MPIELTKFDKRVAEVVKEFHLNNLTCEPYEVIQILDIPPTDRNFTKVERAFVKIGIIVKELRKGIQVVSKN